MSNLILTYASKIAKMDRLEDLDPCFFVVIDNEISKYKRLIDKIKKES